MLIARKYRTAEGLTATERKVCEYLLCGLANEEIASELDLSAQYVKNVMRDLLDFSGMDDRVALALWVHDHREKLGVRCPCESGYCEGALLVNA